MELKDAFDSSRAELLPWMEVPPEDDSIEDYVRRIAALRARFDTRHEMTYVGVLRESGSVLGTLNLDPRPGVGIMAVGGWVRSDHARRHLSLEAVAAATRAAFELFGAQRLEITCDARNAAVAALANRLGYSHEGTLRGRGALRGERFDQMMWGMVAADFAASAAASSPLEAFDGLDRRMTWPDSRPA